MEKSIRQRSWAPKKDKDHNSAGKKRSTQTSKKNVSMTSGPDDRSFSMPAIKQSRKEKVNTNLLRRPT